MLKFQISNPIFKELIKLKLAKKRTIQILFKETRDKKIRVLQDKISKVIFLEKDINSTRKYINNLNPDYTNILKIIKKKKNS